MSKGTRKKIVDFHKIIADKLIYETESEMGRSYKKKTKSSLNQGLLGKKRKKLTKDTKTHGGEASENKFKPRMEKFDCLLKSDYMRILENHREEFETFGIKIDTTNESKVESNLNCGNLISDFVSLNLNLFNYTKFENSKPYKMIDYIMHNSGNFLLNDSDKTRFEEMKKTIFNKSKLSTKENSTIIYKSLFQFFKTDFSTSLIAKVFDKFNSGIQNLFNLEKTNENHLIDSDKKDKFTYQSNLTEKIKNSSDSKDFMNEINNKEILRSLIYMNNKGNKNLSKIKLSDKNFLDVLKKNLAFIEDHEWTEENLKKLKRKLRHNRNLIKLMKKTVDELFKVNKTNNTDDIPDEIEEEISKENKDKLKLKLIELFIKSKEDEFDKIMKSLKKYEISCNISIDGAFSTRYFEDIKQFWAKFKFFFNLRSLNHSEYVCDNNFWKLLIDSIGDNKIPFKQPLIKNKKTPFNTERAIDTEDKSIKANNLNFLLQSKQIRTDFTQMELTLLDRLKNKEDIFQIVKPVNKVTLDSNLLSSPNRTESDDERSSKDVREVKDVKVVIPVSSESTPRAKKVKSCSSEEQIQKPKPIRPVNGGSIIINNFYNILYQPKDSVVKEGSDEAVIKNIIMNIKTKDDPSELGEQNKRKKGRRKKSEQNVK